MQIRKPTAPSIVLFLLCVMYFLTYIDRVNIATAASDIQREFHLSKAQYGFAFSAFAYPYAVFQVIGGRLGDRFGPRRTLFVCGAIWAVATALTGFAVGLVSLIAFRVALGFGEGATFPTATRAMQSWTPTGRRGFAQGVTHSFARLGNAVTPPIVAALIVWITWRGAFAVLGVASLVWVGVWWLYYRDDPRDHAGVTAADLALLPAPDAAKAARPAVPWRRLVPRMLPVTLTYFCYGWSLWLFLTWIPQFFRDDPHLTVHLDLKKSALYSSGVFLAGVVGDALGGILSDYLLHRTGRVTFSRLVVIVIGMLGAAGCLIPVLFTRDNMLLALCLSGGFFFLELVIGPIWAVPMDIAPQYSGTASGLMNLGSALAAIISPPVFGLIVDATGDWHLPFLGSIVLLIIGTALSFTMHPDRKFVDEAELAHPPRTPSP
ncbi:MAG TPA: MFS transporter [Kofleriaceae bacterium]|nr:MFS transporter [Kofleriaceae bacterium]